MADVVRQIDWDELVAIYDPDYRTEEVVEYVFGQEVIKTRRPDQPGSTYHWYTDEE